MSTTINLSSAVLCQYKTGTLGPYTLNEANTQVTGSIYWTHKNGKIAFYFKATSRTANSYYNSQKGFIWYGNQAGNVRLVVGSTSSGWRLFVRQNSSGQVTGYSASGYQSSPGTYDQTNTVTVKAVTSAISLRIELSSSDTASKTVSFTPSVNNMVTTTPSIEYYRSGANVLARVKCVTTRSSTAYSDSYSYTATITVAGSSQSVALTIPSTNTSVTSTSAWVTVQSTANTLGATVTIASTNGGAFSSTQIATLNVPAMSTISGASTGTLGTNYTINITRYDSSFTDSLSYYINGTLIDTIATGITGSTASYTWSSPPVSLAAYAPNAASVAVTVRCTTSSGNTVIGSTDLTVTLSIPATVVPTLGTITLTKVNPNATVDGWDIYLQGYSQCGISVTGSAGVFGSSISSYTVKVGSVTVSGEASSGNANWSGTSPVITVSGSVSVNITCRDSRGRTASSSQTITVHEYSAPTISGALCYRSDSGSNSTELDDGTCIYAYARLNFSGADSHNSASMAVKYRPGTSGSYTSGGTLPNETGTKFGGGTILVSTPWEVVITAADALGNTNSYTFQLPTGMASIHIRPGGTGICFGGYSQHDDSFAIADGISFLAGDSVIRTSLPASGIEGQIILLVSSGTLVPYIRTGNAWISTLLSAYPVGAIYMSTVSTYPGTLFGGTWTQIEDRFLLTAGSTYSAGTSGGNTTHTHTTSGHTLTTSEIPSHSHGTNSSTHTTFVIAKGGDNYAIARKGYASGNNNYAYANTTASDANLSRLGNTGATGGGGSHSHGNTGSGSSMPPYLTVYAWQRTA